MKALLNRGISVILSIGLLVSLYLAYPPRALASSPVIFNGTTSEFSRGDDKVYFSGDVQVYFTPTNYFTNHGYDVPVYGFATISHPGVSLVDAEDNEIAYECVEPDYQFPGLETIGTFYFETSCNLNAQIPIDKSSQFWASLSSGTYNLVLKYMDHMGKIIPVTLLSNLVFPRLISTENTFQLSSSELVSGSPFTITPQVKSYWSDGVSTRECTDGASVQYRLIGSSKWLEATGLNDLGRVKGCPSVFEGTPRASTEYRLVFGGALTAAQTLNVYVPITRPGNPLGLTASSGDRQVSIAFDPPLSDGGADITNYEYSLDGGATWTAQYPSQTTSPIVITSLSNGQSYNVALRAVNSVGSSTGTTALRVTPATRPDSPADCGVLTHTGTSARLSWNAPNSGGSPVISYKVRMSKDGGRSWTSGLNTGGAASSFTLNSLDSGSTYVFQVAAINAVGISDWSDATDSLRLVYVPNQVSRPNIVAKTGSSVTLDWVAPSSNGDGITDYVVEYSGDNEKSWNTFGHQASTIPSVTVTDLTRGVTYLFRISAVNGQGIGPSSVSVAAKPAIKPEVIQDMTLVTASPTSLRLGWTAPDNGGSALTGYRFRYSSNGGLAWSAPEKTSSSTNSFTLSNLISGTSYLVQLAAENSVGVSDWSDTSIAHKTPPKKSQAIIFSQPAPLIIGKSDRRLVGKSTSTGLKIVWTVARKSRSFCSILGGKLHAKAVGSCSVTASQTGSSFYNPAKSVTRIVAIRRK